MHPPEPSAVLHGIAQDISAVDAGGSTHAYHRPLVSFLDQMRTALGMDMVFVSEFVDQQRVFRALSIDPGSPLRVRPGESDPLVETYCRQIVDGTIPRLLRDSGDSEAAVALPITEALGVGAYLSAPVRLPNGTVFGTLCCLSHAACPQLQQQDADALQAVAQAIGSSIDKLGNLKSEIWLRGPTTKSPP